MENKARTARQRAREEITAEIVAAGRTRLAESGPAELSLRAVARDVGMVSSAVYRYFPSRDDLLTALLIAGYDELGAAVEVADDAVDDRADLRARWMVSCRATRAWAVAHPHDYALLYGTPVTGYAAPQDTVAPATRAIIRLIDIVVAGYRSGTISAAQPDGVTAGFGQSFTGARDAINQISGLDADIPPELIGRTLLAWSSVFGVISFELWGHLVGSVDDHEAYFDGAAARLWHDLGGV